ncbi:hypothetical protein ACFL0V_06060 [Nanoarchaeota archaeon]
MSENLIDKILRYNSRKDTEQDGLEIELQDPWGDAASYFFLGIGHSLSVYFRVKDSVKNLRGVYNV